MRSLNPKILEHLQRDEVGQVEEGVSEDVQRFRQEISDEVNRHVEAYMEKFNQLSEGKQKSKIMRLVVGDQLQRLYHSARDKLIGTNNHENHIEQNVEKIEKSNLSYRLKSVFIDGPRSIGLPVPLPYKSLRIPSGSYFNRAFPFYNVVVPLGFLGLFAAIGSSNFSPVDTVNNTNVENIIDALYVGAAGIIAQGAIIASGAADTAGAALSAAWETIADQGRKGIKWVGGNHSKVIYDAIEGKNGAVMYEIPLIETESPRDQIAELLAPTFKDRKLRSTKTLQELDDSFIFQYSLGNKLPINQTPVTAVKQPGQDVFRLYSNLDLGEHLAQYKINPVNISAN